MQTLLASQVASISELKKNPSKLIQDSHGRPVAILNHNTAAAYLISVETFEKMMELIDDTELSRVVEERMNTSFESIKVDIDEL